MQYPVQMTYKCYFKDSRKDLDNVAFAVKLIHDELLAAGV
ncbi:hypothetical protein LCGC14_0001610 [marine sediment metagenome]|uniref:Uncharacterized protein n=1 Tax=marine sediment metagenome TaxID=412755 RepID=A0A0F9WHY7_9ZZZZ